MAGLRQFTDNNDTKIMGDSDGTLIGNIGDAIKVTSDPDSVSGAPVLSNMFRVELSATSQALTASYTNVYTYSGSGKLSGVETTFSKQGGAVKIIIDGTETILDIVMSQLDMIQTGFIVSGITVYYDGSKNSFVFSPTFPIYFNSSVTVQARRAASNPDLSGYIVALTKDT